MGLRSSSIYQVKRLMATDRRVIGQAPGISPSVPRCRPTPTTPVSVKMMGMSVLDRRQAIPLSVSAKPPACARLDGVMALLCGWLVLGLYIDGWAHRHFKIETFFTPWHLILYTGFLSVASCLLVALYRNHIRGYPWRRAMPAGYELSFLGLAIFMLSGFGDLIWHELFGFEHDLEALLSPTHLVLALGGTLMIAGRFRSAWQRDDHPSAPSLATQWPMLLSLTLLLSIMTFFTQFAHPFVEIWLVQEKARWDLQREIFIMQADGRGQTRLARSPGQGVSHPCWSADGRRIVFAAGTWTHNQNVPSDAEIYVMDADGTDPIRLTDNDSYDGHPSWSPDASQIAFESFRDGTHAIYVMNADGSKQVRITHSPGRQVLPAWSPDGEKIVFVSERDGATEIDVIDVKGGDQARLTTVGEDSYPVWSPNGQQIAFASRRDGDWKIYVMDASGRNLRRLTHDKGSDRFPSWSPDGRRIAFASNRDKNWEVYAIVPEGEIATNLTNNPATEDATDARPSWSPDSTRITFGSIGHPRHSRFLRQALGIASILVQTALAMGLILLTVWRWDLSFPSLTLVFTLNAALNLTQSAEYHFPLLGAAALAGLAADLLLKLLKPSASKPQALRLFGFTVPSLFYGAFFMVLMFTGAIGWSAHLWMGSILLAGITGWLLSCLLVPPSGKRGSPS